MKHRYKYTILTLLAFIFIVLFHTQTANASSYYYIDENTDPNSTIGKSVTFTNYTFKTNYRGLGVDSNGSINSLSRPHTILLGDSDNPNTTGVGTGWGTVTLNIKGGSGYKKGDTLMIAFGAMHIVYRNVNTGAEHDANYNTTSVQDVSSSMQGISSNVHLAGRYLEIPIDQDSFDTNKDYTINLRVNQAGYDLSYDPWWSADENLWYTSGGNGIGIADKMRIYMGTAKTDIKINYQTFDGTPSLTPAGTSTDTGVSSLIYGAKSETTSSNMIVSKHRVQLNNPDSYQAVRDKYSSSNYIQALLLTNNGAAFNRIDFMTSNSLNVEGNFRAMVQGDSFYTNVSLANWWDTVKLPNYQMNAHTISMTRANVDTSGLSSMDLKSAVDWGTNNLSPMTFATTHVGNKYLLVYNLGNMKDNISKLYTPVYMTSTNFTNFLNGQDYIFTPTQQQAIINSFKKETVNGEDRYELPTSARYCTNLGTISSSNLNVPLDMTKEMQNSLGDYDYNRYVGSSGNINTVVGESAIKVNYIDLDTGTILDTKTLYGYYQGKDVNGKKTTTSDDSDGDGTTNLPPLTVEGYDLVPMSSLTVDNKTTLSKFGTPSESNAAQAFLASGTAMPTYSIGLKPKPQYIRFQYYDTDSNKLISTDDISGKSGYSGVYSYKLPANYNYQSVTAVTGNGFTGATSKSLNYTYDSKLETGADTSTQVFRINMTHTHQQNTDNVNKQVTSSYKMTTGDSTKLPATKTQTVTFVSDKDMITGALKWTPNVTSITPPAITGYTVLPTSVSFASTTSKPTTKDSYTFTYTPVQQTIEIDYIDNDTGKVLKQDSVTTGVDTTTYYTILPEYYKVERVSANGVRFYAYRHNLKQLELQATTTSGKISVYVDNSATIFNNIPLTGSLSLLFVIISAIIFIVGNIVLNRKSKK